MLFRLGLMIEHVSCKYNMVNRKIPLLEFDATNLLVDSSVLSDESVHTHVSLGSLSCVSHVSVGNDQTIEFRQIQLPRSEPTVLSSAHLTPDVIDSRRLRCIACAIVEQCIVTHQSPGGRKLRGHTGSNRTECLVRHLDRSDACDH
jgi:hypothetical protein